MAEYDTKGRLTCLAVAVKKVETRKWKCEDGEANLNESRDEDKNEDERSIDGGGDVAEQDGKGRLSENEEKIEKVSDETSWC